MNPRIGFERVWVDGDMAELQVEICDGSSTFRNKVYVGHEHLRESLVGLGAFQSQIHGGIFTLRFGAFGLGYASGALELRLHFRNLGKILATVRAQSEPRQLEAENVVGEAKLYLVTEPALLDDFIRGMRALSDGSAQLAELEAIPWM